MSEHQEQVAVIQWARREERHYPELALLHAIPNASKRTPAMCAWMVAEGLKRGVPDLCLPIRRGQYSGLYIEMKKAGGTVKPEQKAWRDALQAQGFAVYIAVGSQAAIQVILEFMSLGRPLDAGLPAAAQLQRAQIEAETKKQLAKWRKKNKWMRSAA